MPGLRACHQPSPGASQPAVTTRGRNGIQWDWNVFAVSYGINDAQDTVGDVEGGDDQKVVGEVDVNSRVLSMGSLLSLWYYNQFGCVAMVGGDMCF